MGLPSHKFTLSETNVLRINFSSHHVVPRVGLEPTRSIKLHRILSPACIPFHHPGICKNNSIKSQIVPWGRLGLPCLAAYTPAYPPDGG